MLPKYGECNWPDYPYPPFNNHIVGADGAEVKIDDPAAFALAGTNTASIRFMSNEMQISYAKDNIAEIHLRIPVEGASASNFCQYLFAQYTNCTVFDFLFEGEITEVGDNFCYYMFSGTTQLTRSMLNSELNLPQDIITAGDGFCYSMFRGTSLEGLPSEFNLPQELETVGNQCFQYMFRNTTLTSGLPSGFNISPKITTCGANFCSGMLTQSQIVLLPSSFTCPQMIINTGSGMYTSMFEGCSNLIGLPIGFRLSKDNGWTDVSVYYNQAFYDCSSLALGTTPGDPILQFEYNANSCFGGSCPVTPITPTAGTAVQIVHAA